MKKILPKGLTYNDVLLVPQKSGLKSRSLVDTSTNLSKHITLKIPFVSSNVDTVTESAMAIAMAKMGGIGIIHRFMTIEEQVHEVDKVKRREGFVLGNPLTISPDKTLGEAKVLMKENDVTSVIVVDGKNKIMGLISDRDTWFEDNLSTKITLLMTPAKKLITASPNVTLAVAKKIFKQYKVEKLPLISKDGVLLGLITSRTVLNEDIYPNATKDNKGRLRVGVAVGVVGDYLERAKALVRAGADVLVVDIAHVHSIHGLEAIKKMRGLFSNIDIIGGNIATAEGAKDLIRLGCDGLKVGIGPGGICITRMVAGAGVPQLTAIMEIAEIAHKKKIPIIADGGTNYPGDMTKALAAGASTVMLTGWLAGTDESPGSIILRNGKKYKVHRGAASFSAVASRKINGIANKINGQIPLTTTIGGQVRKELLENDDLDQELSQIIPEGVETFVPFKGPVKDVVYQLLGALRSGMSYCNAEKVADLWTNAQFIEITSAGFSESKAHNVEEM